VLDVNTVLGIAEVKSYGKRQRKQVNVLRYLCGILLYSRRYQIVFYGLCEVKNDLFNFFFDEFRFCLNSASFGVFTFWWRSFDLFSCFSAGYWGTLGLKASQSVIFKFSSVCINEDVFKLVQILLVYFNALVSELIPSNESALFDNVYCFFSLIKVVHKFRKVAKEFCVLCIGLEVFLSM